MPLFKSRPGTDSPPTALETQALPPARQQPTPPESPPRRRPTGAFFNRARPASPVSMTDSDFPPPTPTTSGWSDYRSAHSRAASIGSSFFFRSHRSSGAADADADAASVLSQQTTPTIPSLRSRRTVDRDAASVVSTPTLASKSSNVFTRSLRKYTGHVESDPKVQIAREKIANAAEAEREADRALMHARARVRDAMASIKVLEEEAEEEAQRAQAKSAVSRLMSRSARGLGRHG